MGVNFPSDEKVDLKGFSTNAGTLPADIPKPKAKPRVKKTDQQLLLEELKEIKKILALNLLIILRQEPLTHEKVVDYLNKMVNKR